MYFDKLCLCRRVELERFAKEKETALQTAKEVKLD